MRTAATRAQLAGKDFLSTAGPPADARGRGRTAAARAQLAGKDFISTGDGSKDELGLALDVAAELKAAFKVDRAHRLLPDRTLFMIFFALSTPTRTPFAA